MNFHHLTHSLLLIYRVRSEAQILREQQDLEYQESLAADRRREEEARRQQQLEEEERQRQEEEARRAEEEKHREEAQRHASIAEKRERLAGSEPPSRRPPPGADYKTAVLKFHLHNGTRLERVFYAHDTLQTVRDYIDVEFFDRDIPITNYELATNFPKKVYGPELIDVSLTDAVRHCVSQ